MGRRSRFSKTLKHLTRQCALLLICLSCTTAPKFTSEVNAEQCSPEISLIIENGKRYIDENNSACMCRLYKYSQDYIGPIGSPYKTDLKKCHRIIGVSAERYEAVNNFLQSIK